MHNCEECGKPVTNCSCPVETMKPMMRDSVKQFAREMEKQLKANDHKGGWDKCTFKYLFERLEEETAELSEFFVLNDERNEYQIQLDNVGQIVREAADVANFALMIAENAVRYREKLMGTKSA